MAGIVLSRFWHDEKVKTEYQEILTHHPLGLGGVLHARFVLDTLAAGAKEETAKPAEKQP